MKDNVYQHFRQSEKEFIDQVLNARAFAEDTYAPKLLDFLNPRQQHIVQSIIGTLGDVQADFFGGSPQNERKRALIYPSYFSPGQSDFQIRLYDVEYPRKFVSLDHRQVLGSILATGLKREKFGDILVSEDRIQLFCAEEIGDYLCAQMTKVGKAAVKLLPAKESIQPEEEWKEKEASVSSLRLDAVLSSILNMSRQKVQTLISRGLVQVNWAEAEEASFQCEEGDVMSIRGFGRCKLLVIEGKTKKEKWRIKAGLLK